jgi:hypothetical protein
MTNYMYDPDIRAVLESGFAIPPGLEATEVDRLREFLRWDQDMERFDRSHPDGGRAPYPLLRGLAGAAMAAYDQCSDRLPIGWQKLLVLRAGIAGCTQNLDDSKIEDWAYTIITDESRGWLVSYEGTPENEPPLNWLLHVLEPEVLRMRRFKQKEMEGKVSPSNVDVAGSGCLVAVLGAIALIRPLLSHRGH